MLHYSNITKCYDKDNYKGASKSLSEIYRKYWLRVSKVHLEFILGGKLQNFDVYNLNIHGILYV